LPVFEFIRRFLHVTKTKLSPQQQQAVQWLALPGKGGLTYAEIAEEVGVSRRTLYEWRNSKVFESEVKRKIIKYSSRRLPDMMKAITEAIIKDRNAAAMKL